MRTQSIPKFLIASMLCAFLVSAFRASAYLKEYGNYIEVCAKGLATVPKDVQYVKCNGIVRKVIRLEQTLAESQGDCLCPTCCDGLCYIMVAVEGGGIGFLWLAC
jgi:hypothetical protein